MRALPHQHGFSLLEMLTAGALAGFLAVVLIKLYQLFFASHLQSGMRAEILNTVLTAEHVLHRSLHLASTRPCGSGGARQSLVRGLSELDSFASGGAHITNPKRLRSGRYSVMGDVVTVHKTGPPHRLAEHNKPMGHFLLHEPGPFSPGDLVVVCDRQRTVLIQITGTENGGQRLVYKNQAQVLPGNCRGAFVSCPCGCGYTFDKQAVLALYQPLILFVSPRPGGSRTPAEHALFRSYLVTERSANRSAARLHSEELVAGIVFAHAALSGSGANVKQLDYGIVMPAPRARQPEKAVYLFGRDVSPSLPAGPDGSAYHSYEFSFSL